MKDDVIASVYLDLNEANREIALMTLQRIFDIQDNNRHAELIIKFHGGKWCHGGGMKELDGPCPGSGGYMVKD